GPAREVDAGTTGAVPGARRRRWLWVAALAVVVLIGAAGLAWPHLGGGKAAVRQPAGHPSDAANTGDIPGSEVTGQNTDPYVLPDGWVWYNDPTGYRIAV